MITLDPHVVLVTLESPSRAAMLLRDGGYLVTKVDPDEALLAVASLAPDAMVVELTAFRLVSFLRSLDRAQPEVPALVITMAPSLFHARQAIDRRDIETELVNAVDRMLADAHPMTMPA
ncbi:MAG TPA: hypothetical protein VFN10_00290 [Thermoanaerobaculia bacterium]|nr:hypothetical protein [Thermoanaerobaculia bacterium]